MKYSSVEVVNPRTINRYQQARYAAKSYLFVQKYQWERNPRSIRK